jgi:transposase
MSSREKFLSDAQWAHIEPLLPELPRSSRGGRPWADSRSVFEGILWVLKTGARWRDLPDRFPSPATCWRRLHRWHEEGVWLELWRAYLSELNEKHRLKWEETFVDGTFAPAKKGVLASERPSGARAQSAWWWSTARVFLWEFTSPQRPRRKSRSSKPHLRRSESVGKVRAGRGRNRRA